LDRSSDGDDRLVHSNDEFRVRGLSTDFKIEARGPACDNDIVGSFNLNYTYSTVTAGDASQAMTQCITIHWNVTLR